MSLQFPNELLEKFKETSFCPGDLIKGRPDAGLNYNTLRVEYHPPGSGYAEANMFYDFHRDGKVSKASRPFADWGHREEAEFVQAVVEWLQSYTAIGGDA